MAGASRARAEGHLSHTLVTGASAGIGLELARLFAAAGEPLVLTSRDESRLLAAADLLRRDHEVDVRVMPADLAHPDTPGRLAARLADEGIGVCHLVNNAGFGVYGEFVSREPQVYRDLIDLNVRALTDLTRLLLAPMLAAPRDLRRGVLNVASTAAFQPGPLMAAYFASKAYVLSFSEALHEETRAAGVTVTAFCPGPTRTDFFRHDTMIPSGVVAADGSVDPAALDRYERRDRRRMDPAVAARVGFDGYRAGRAVVIPGRLHALTARVPGVLPRSLVRRIVHRMMRK